MKYYSEKDNKLYDSIQELQKAESDFDKATAEEAVEKEAIINLAHSISEDKQKIRKMLVEYLKKYNKFSFECEDKSVIKDAINSNGILSPFVLWDFFK